MLPGSHPFKNVKHLVHHVSGMSLNNNPFNKLCCCEVCKNAKSRRQPVLRKLEKRKSSKLDVVLIDILGPRPTTLLCVNRYAFLLRIATAGTQQNISLNREGEPK